MKNKIKRLTALLLALAMSLSLLCGSAWAAEVEPAAETPVETVEDVPEQAEEEGAEESAAAEPETPVEEPEEAPAGEEEAQEPETEAPEETPEEEPVDGAGEQGSVEELLDAAQSGEIQAQSTGLKGTCGENLTWEVDKDGVLTISGTGEMDDYGDESFAPWSSLENEDVEALEDGITAVVIEEGVTSIGNLAFALESVKTATLPSSLQRIGEGAFLMTELEKVTIPASVKVVEAEAFEYCTELTSLTIQNGVQEIGEGAFSGCTSLEKVTIPASVKTVGDLAFESCEKLTSLTIQEGVEKIGDSAFETCGLRKVTIPASVTTIEEYAFGYEYYYDEDTDEEEDRKISGFVISGYPDTAAESYAKANKFTFKNLNGTDEPEELDTPVLKSIANTSKGVTIKWEKVSGAACYHISRKAAGDKKWTGIADVTGTSYTDTKGKSGTTYTYTVRCISEKGGEFTSSYNKKGLKIVCLSRPSISSVKNTASGIQVTWKKVTGADGYYVYRDTGDGFKKLATAKSTSYTDSYSKSEGREYKYRVYAYQGSTKSCISTGKRSYWLSQPSVSSVTNSAAGKLTVKWKKNAKATGYQVQYSTSSSFDSYKTVKITKNATVSKVISGLKKGKTYYVRVRAYKTVSDVNYYSSWSGKKSIKLTK